MLLRNFYSGTDLRYDQNGTVVSAATPGAWTLANVEITGITVTAQEIEIAGNRLGMLYTGEKQGFVRVGRLKVRLARPNANVDTEVILDPVLTNIFIKPGEDLRPMLPDYWRYYLTGTDSPSRLSAWEAALEKGTGPQGSRTAGLTAPKPVNTPDPKYTKEAASQHIEGRSVLRTVIDATGTPGSIAVLEPLGMGLDEQAVAP